MYVAHAMMQGGVSSSRRVIKVAIAAACTVAVASGAAVSACGGTDTRTVPSDSVARPTGSIVGIRTEPQEPYRTAVVTSALDGSAERALVPFGAADVQYKHPTLSPDRT